MRQRTEDSPTDPELPDPIRLMQVGTSHLSIGLMRGQLKFLREAGFEVSIVSGPGPTLESVANDERVQAYAVPMAREIAGFDDLVSFWKLWRLMRKVRPTITNVGTPKAGLLGGIAAWVSRVPCRVYTLRGLRCETSRGWKRWCLALAERIACSCAQRVVCVSNSLSLVAANQGICDPRKLVVLGDGSSNGVNSERFAPTPERIGEASFLRDKMDIAQHVPVIGFVGRLTRDKGICELVEAYLLLRQTFPTLRLMLLGDFEEEDPIPNDIRTAVRTNQGIVHARHVDDPAPYYHVMNVLVLPTHREGFPNVVLEAQAAAKPVVTTCATGARDAIEDGVTGILVPVADVPSLVAAIEHLLKRPDLAQRMGVAGQARVRQRFGQEIIWDLLNLEFRRLLGENGLPVPSVAHAALSSRSSNLVAR